MPAFLGIPINIHSTAQPYEKAVHKRRAWQAGISKDISPHSMRATGITAFLEHDGELESAQRIAAHSDPRTTKLYDRRGEKIDQGEIERIRFD